MMSAPRDFRTRFRPERWCEVCAPQTLIDILTADDQHEKLITINEKFSYH